MGNFFINGYDLYAEVMKDTEAFLWKIVTASSISGSEIGNDMKEAVSEIVASRSYEDVSEVCERVLSILDGAIGVQEYIKKES